MNCNHYKLLSFLTSLLVCSFTAFAQSSYSGIVSDADGEPLAGVVVLSEGLNEGVMTDDNGKFSIEAAKGDALLFTMLGFEDVKVVLTENRTVNVTMIYDDLKLEESVVVGYGSIRKRDLTGSVASIDNDVLKNYPATNFQEMLAGRAAGVETTMSSGKPGDVAEVRIRGIGTVNGTSPLYVVDGVPLNRTVDIDPRSIESMQVLKDASATAIYGSRGSNGVILITTKKGKDGALNVSFDAYVGFSELFVKYRQASSAQLYDFYLEQCRNDNIRI